MRQTAAEASAWLGAAQRHVVGAALSSRNAFAVACNAPQPPAGASFGWKIDLSDIRGLRRGAVLLSKNR
jgi:hypothetical protein